jgi:hypothetical protein
MGAQHNYAIVLIEVESGFKTATNALGRLMILAGDSSDNFIVIPYYTL